MERQGIISSKGKSLTLLGQEIIVGRKAPDFEVVDNSMQSIKAESIKGLRIISVVPSLDTPTCDLQTRRFNKEAEKLNIKVYTISMDLPFAQKRWCGQAGITSVITFSDYRERSFGMNYGLLIKETKLLARAVVIIASSNVIQYLQIVPDLSKEPNYVEVLEKLKTLS